MIIQHCNTFYIKDDNICISMKGTCSPGIKSNLLVQYWIIRLCVSCLAFNSVTTCKWLFTGRTLQPASWHVRGRPVIILGAWCRFSRTKFFLIPLIGIFLHTPPKVFVFIFLAPFWLKFQKASLRKIFFKRPCPGKKFKRPSWGKKKLISDFFYTPMIFNAWHLGHFGWRHFLSE